MVLSWLNIGMVLRSKKIFWDIHVDVVDGLVLKPVAKLGITVLSRMHSTDRILELVGGYSQ